MGATGEAVELMPAGNVNMLAERLPFLLPVAWSTCAVCGAPADRTSSVG